jgi:5-hydroxyisourate hydrolase
LSISTHVLDTAIGAPARDVPVVLEREVGGASWREVGRGRTDEDGRVKSFVSDAALVGAGVYRLVFDTRGYFTARGVAGFYPSVAVTFDVRSADEHYHVPLLLSPYGYSTYRGS